MAGIIKSDTSDFTLSRKAKRDWLKALRSGKYEQGKGRLFGDGNYCCLGVLCSVNGIPDAQLKQRLIPKAVAGIPSWALGVDYRVMFYGRLTKLAGLNDSEGLTFRQIADLIEKNVPCHD